MRYLIIINLLFIFLAVPALAYDCPFNRINDPYPGSCSLYVDNNYDRLCDNSQPIDRLALGDTQKSFPETEAVPAVTKTKHYISYIILLFIIFELLGISLIQYGKLKKITWRKIHNYALLLSFIVVVFTSLIALLNLSGVIYTENLRFFNWLHTEAGLVMILLSMVHAIQRWRYFKIRL